MDFVNYNRGITLSGTTEELVYHAAAYGVHVQKIGRRRGERYSHCRFFKTSLSITPSTLIQSLIELVSALFQCLNILRVRDDSSFREILGTREGELCRCYRVSQGSLLLLTL